MFGTFSQMSLSKPLKVDPVKLDLAIEVVYRGFGVRRAAQMYGISKSTLCNRVKNQRKSTPGPEPMLMRGLEDRVVSWIVKMAQIGYGQTKEQIKDKVQELVNLLKMKTPWEDGRPSEKFYCLFMKRHPELKYRMSQALARERCRVSFTDIATWFKELKEFILASNHP